MSSYVSLTLNRGCMITYIQYNHCFSQIWLNTLRRSLCSKALSVCTWALSKTLGCSSCLRSFLKCIFILLSTIILYYAIPSMTFSASIWTSVHTSEACGARVLLQFCTEASKSPVSYPTKDHGKLHRMCVKSSSGILKNIFTMKMHMNTNAVNKQRPSNCSALAVV